jgi:N-acetylgalactosamine-6-sulfatase
VPFTAPHAPFQGPDDRQAKPLAPDSPLWNQGKAPPEVYAAMVERLDGAVGRILAALEKQGLDSRTLVVFTSDNGGTASARPTPLAGVKGSTFEGGIRVPCVVRWPGVLPAQTTTDQPALTMDLTASLVRLAGAQAPKERPFDGIDIVERLEKQEPALQRTLFWRGRRGGRTWWAVRQGPLKYVARQDGDQKAEYLFDLGHDPGEKDNLAAARPSDLTRLKELLAEWELKVQSKR